MWWYLHHKTGMINRNCAQNTTDWLWCHHFSGYQQMVALISDSRQNASLLVESSIRFCVNFRKTLVLSAQFILAIFPSDSFATCEIRILCIRTREKFFLYHKALSDAMHSTLLQSLHCVGHFLMHLTILGLTSSYVRQWSQWNQKYIWTRMGHPSLFIII